MILIKIFLNRQKRPVMCVIATKCDHVTQRCVSSNQGQELAARLNCQYFESSPREGAMERVTKTAENRNSLCSSSSGDSGCESDAGGRIPKKGKVPGQGGCRFEAVEFDAPLSHLHGNYLKSRRTGISAPSPTFLRSKFRKFCKITSITS